MHNSIILVDGSSFIFRAFYAITNLHAPDKTPTNAIYGVINMLKQLQKRYTTQYWACVFDTKGKTFRDDIYPEYKANRRETPPELITQIPYIHQIVADLGIPVIMQSGIEADDIIATIAKKYVALGFKVIIATGDKDFAQIVDENITLINTMNNEILDIDGVINKFGVMPTQIIDYLSLIGDSADNVPGVHKCGPKTAQKWLNQYGSIEQLVKHQEQLTGVVGENFRKAIPWLATAQRLITVDSNALITAVDINNLANISLSSPKIPQLIEIFTRLNFKNWLREYTQLDNSNSAVNLNLSTETKPKNDTINSNISLFDDTEQSSTNDEILATNKSTTIYYIKTAQELTDKLTPIIKQNTISSFALYLNDYSDNSSAIHTVVINSTDQTLLIELDQTNTTDLLVDISNNPNNISIANLSDYFMADCPKICYNLKQNLYILDRYNIYPQNIIGDLMLAAYLQSSQQDNNNLAAIINRCLLSDFMGIEEFCGKGSKKILWDNLDLDQRNNLAINLTSSIIKAHQTILAELSAQELDLYQQVELPLTPILFAIEQQGMFIDRSLFKQMSVEFNQKLSTLEQQIYQATNCVFNINSPKQLQDVLFNKLQLSNQNIKKNLSGLSTNEESLNTLAASGYQVAEFLLEYRYLSKLINTYINKLPLAADHHGLIHTSLEQTIVSSGRLSSKDPNLQNIPIRSEYGQMIRRGFIALPNHHLVCADYSQIELRILAHISGDDNLISAFNNKLDIHTATASQIFHKPLNEITKDERRYAKTINFGLIYGKSVFGLAKELKIDRAAAKTYIDSYFAQFPKVLQFMENIKRQAHQDSYVATIYGRKIYLSNINSSNNITRQAEERLALNAPMQGTAADIIKIAMIHIDKWLKEQRLNTKMVLQVHDELIFQVPDNELFMVTKHLPQLMTSTTKLIVPLDVEIGIGQNWSEAH